MQTFLPYPDLRASCQVLDGPRLGKQRVETFQILRALTWPEYAWKNHPAVRMWRGFVPALVAYGVESCREWTRRGHADSVLPQLLGWSGGRVPVGPPLPPWFGLSALHLSHRSALLRKDPALYRQVFGPDEPDDLPYLWPPDVFPRWPVRRAGRDLDLAGALQVLGLTQARAGQAEAVAAVRAGRDCLLVAAPGHGGSTTGLLAGLALPGSTLVVRPPGGPVSYDVPEVALVPPRELPPADDALPAEAAAVEAAGVEAAGVEAAGVDRAAVDSPAVDRAAVDSPAADRPPPLARPPSEVDLAAMRAETAPPEFVFGPADTLPPDCTLVVVDGADDLLPPAHPVLPAGRPPALVVVRRADRHRRAALTAALGLREPVLAGGGWDPAGTWLGVREAATRPALRRLVPDVVRDLGPALVHTASRDRLDRTVAALAAAGLRAAGWDPGMRATRAAAAVAAWRSRRLDALVVVSGRDVPLGRARVPLLLAADAPPTRECWRDAVATLAPAWAVLVVGPGAPADAVAYAQTPGCRRAALLAPYGEPVVTPCGRCDRCDG